ncbi:hypothetical protein U9D55_003874 [Enterobacter roggenkampii]|nr:hypothetical protein [Enterobacter roggenkampii]
MQVIVFSKQEAPFVHTIPEYEKVLLYLDDKGNVHILDVNINFIEKEDRNVSTVITASEEMIDLTKLMAIAKELNYL